MASSILVGSFSPSSLSGCVLWLDGSSLGLSNGATVSSWSSLGPVSYTTSSTSGRFPTYATNVQNGRGCVQYATGQTSILSNFSLSGTQSIFLLYYPINTSAGSPFLEQGPDVNGNDGFYFHAQNNNNYVIRNGGTSGATNFGTTAVTNTWQLIEGLNRDPNAGNTMGFYCNATLLASNGVQNGVTPVTNTLFLNGRNNTNTLSYPAYVAELIIYDTPLNPFGRQQVEGYLAWKWGLTSFLPSNHPYKSVAYFTIIETVPRTIPTNSFLLPVNTFSTVKTITLPIVSTNPGRILVLKDYLGYAASNTIRLSTVGLDRIERSSVSSMILSNSYAAYWFTNDGMTNWFLTDAYLNTLGIVEATPPWLPGLYVKTYANTGSIPDNNGPATAAGSSGNWGALLTTTFVGAPYSGSNTPGGSSVFYYGNDFGIYPSGNLNFSYIARGSFFSATSGTIQFQIETDDGMRVDFNNVNVLNQWQQQGRTGYTSASVTLPAGYTPLLIRWYDTGGGGCSLFRWSINGGGYSSNGSGVLFYAQSNLSQT
jgi:hypothetical protein